MYLGDFNAGATIHFLWSTNGTNGASITRATNGTVSVYKNNGVTQDVDGITDTEDFDALTGIHACTIDLSADAIFYSAGANFSVVLSGATIDGQVVNAVLAHFSIENRPQSLRDGAITAAKIASDAITDAKVASDVTIASVTGAVGSVTAGVTLADGAITAAKIASDAITAAKVAADVTTEIQSGLATAAALAVVDGIVDDILADTADMQPKLGTPAVSISADIAAIEAQTDDIGVAGAGLTAVPWNAAWDAEVQSEVADALAAYDPPTNAEMVARTLASADYATAANLATVDTVVDSILVDTAEIGAAGAGLTALASASALATVDSNVDDILVDTGTTLPATLVTIAGYIDTEVAAVKAVTDKLDTALELDGAVYRYTANALEQAPSGGGGGVSDWTTGEKEQIRHRLGIDGDAAAPSATPSLASAADLATVDGVVDAVLADTAAMDTRLPSDPADQSLIIDATNAIMTRLGSPTGASVSADVAAVKAQTAAIEADTQDLQTQVGVDGDGLTAIGDTRIANLDAAVSSRLATSGYTTPPSAATNASAVRTELTTELGRIDVATSTRLAGSSYTAPPTADQNADALLDRADAIESGLTLRGALRLATAAEAGKVAGAETTTITIRNVGDTKTRITATVDENGNRTAVTTDAT